MPRTFGFNEEELKLLLVAVRQMRRTFAQAQARGAKADPALASYAELYEALFTKLLDMAGVVPNELQDALE